jgi:hypothetical protein
MVNQGRSAPLFVAADQICSNGCVQPQQAGPLPVVSSVTDRSMHDGQLLVVALLPLPNFYQLKENQVKENQVNDGI